MKAYVITDLEGAAMVSTWAETRDDHDDPAGKRRAMELLTGEVNAAVDGILAAAPGAEVVVWDGHGSGGVDVMSFHPDAKLIAGKGIRPPYGLDAGRIPAVRAEPPYVQEIRVQQGCSIEGYLKAGAEQLDERTVRLQRADICELYI
jgi:hypothetical protein